MRKLSENTRHTAKKKSTEGFGLLSTRTASANYNVTDNIPREKPEDEAAPPCLPHKLKQSNRMKEWLIPNKLGSWCLEPSQPLGVTSGLDSE